MITRRLFAGAVTAGLLSTIVSCSSSGPERRPESQRPSSPSSGPPATKVVAPAVDRAKVVASILAGGQRTTSQTITVSETGASANNYVQGSRTFTRGEVAAFELEVSGADILSSRVIGTRGRTYAQFRTTTGGTGSKYVRIAERGDPDALRVFALLNSMIAPTSPNAIAAMVRASPTIVSGPSIPLGGSRTTVHYTLKPALEQLRSTDFPRLYDLLAAGLTTISVELYVDQDGRPVRIDTVPDQGKDTVESTAEFHDYNKPVTVKAPERSQITGG